MGRAGPNKGYQQVFIHTPHSGAATGTSEPAKKHLCGHWHWSRRLPPEQRSGLYPPDRAPPCVWTTFFFWGSLVSWSAQADHCGMITCERFVPTPPAACCQESGSTGGVHGTLALGATSRCLFTIDITKVIFAGLPVDISVFLCLRKQSKIRPRPAQGLFSNEKT